jgi:hypothetical protein
LTKTGVFFIYSIQKNRIQYTVYSTEKATSCQARGEAQHRRLSGFLDALENGALNGGFAASGKERFGKEPQKGRGCTRGEREEAADDGFFVPNHPESLSVRRER